MVQLRVQNSWTFWKEIIMPLACWWGYSPQLCPVSLAYKVSLKCKMLKYSRARTQIGLDCPKESSMKSTFIFILHNHDIYVHSSKKTPIFIDRHRGFGWLTSHWAVQGYFIMPQKMLSSNPCSLCVQLISVSKWTLVIKKIRTTNSE